MATATGKVMEGRTLDADAPFASGDFWEVGKTIKGEVSRVYATQFDGKSSLAYVVELEEPVDIDGEEWDRVSIGNMAGLRLALQSCHTDRLYSKDVIELECESIKKAKKEGYSPRPNFRLKISRP